MTTSILPAGTDVTVRNTEGRLVRHTTRESIPVTDPKPARFNPNLLGITHKGFEVFFDPTLIKEIKTVTDSDNLLAGAIEATQNKTATGGGAAPTIVSRNDDPNDINWVQGMSDPGEMIGCGMYQQLRRLDGESDADYQKRLVVLLAGLPADVRGRIESFGKKAALRRAGLDTSNGKVAVMVAGQVPWHGLGVNVKEAVSSADAIRLASMDWTVSKKQLQFVNPVTGQLQNAPGCYGIVREDTGKFLGNVGERYEPFQNAAGFDFLDRLLGEFGARYESAGSLYGGKKVWMLVRLPEQDFTINGVDRTEAYAIFTNCHDGSEAARCYPTSERVVCANTLRLSRKDGDKGITIRHVGDLRAKVASAQAALGVTVRRMDEFRKNAELLAATRVEPTPYFEGLLDAVCEVTQAQAVLGADALANDLLATAVGVTQAQRDFEVKRFNKAIEKRSDLLEELCNRYDSEKNGIGGMRGTGWAAFNAVTEAADHGKLGGRTVGTDKASRRFESVLNGAADDVKQIAYQQVMALAG